MIRAVLLFLFAATASLRGAGVTIITHGLNSNADDWVLAMAQRIPLHPSFQPTNFSCFAMDVAQNLTVSAMRIGGVGPSATDSGEIIIKLDWGLLANNSFSTYQVAAAILPTLLQTNFILGLAGHALAEYPLHLIGHSRGGSLICELSRLLGTNGIWVDQITTLDPHPLNNDGFMDSPLYTVVDAPARTYENVLFHDNYFQIIDFFIYGESVLGAYTRQLTSLDGGYGGIGGAHSDVHLWYHGTLDLRTPARDSVSSVEATQRQTWWTAAERGGTNTGFFWSRLGGGNRLELGAANPTNREPLLVNSGAWPNIIDLRLAGTNLTYLYQGPNATISFGVDPDGNPINGNEQIFRQLAVTATGVNNIGSNIVGIPNPGLGRVFARIASGTRSRFLYLPAAPRMSIAKSSATDVAVTVFAKLGQTVVLQRSTDLNSWQPFATNTLTGSSWSVPATATGRRFYRGVLP